MLIPLAFTGVASVVSAHFSEFPCGKSLRNFKILLRKTWKQENSWPSKLLPLSDSHLGIFKTVAMLSGCTGSECLTVVTRAELWITGSYFSALRISWTTKPWIQTNIRLLVQESHSSDCGTRILDVKAQFLPNKQPCWQRTPSFFHCAMLSGARMYSGFLRTA